MFFQNLKIINLNWYLRFSTMLYESFPAETRLTVYRRALVGLPTVISASGDPGNFHDSLSTAWHNASRPMKALSIYTCLALSSQNSASGDPEKSVKSMLHLAAQQRRLLAKQVTKTYLRSWSPHRKFSVRWPWKFSRFGARRCAQSESADEGSEYIYIPRSLQSKSCSRWSWKIRQVAVAFCWTAATATHKASHQKISTQLVSSPKV